MIRLGILIICLSLGIGSGCATRDHESKEDALFTAASRRRINDVAALLKNGANIESRDVSDSTPLHNSIKEGNYVMALFLYRAGADPLSKDKWNYSCIDTIKEYGVREYVARVDKKAYKELVEELKKQGLLDKS